MNNIFFIKPLLINLNSLYTLMIDLSLGSIYNRSEIHDKIGGQRQYGISTPQKYNVILLFTGLSGKVHGYHDGWREGGVFLYSGEGQIGDMTFTRGNAEIRDHIENNKELHLFEILGKGRVRYIGQMVCLGYGILEEDARGIRRKIIQFELASIYSINNSE